MLQLDWIITFAIGSSIATAAGDALKTTPFHTQNRYFVFTLLHINLIVIPLNLYMLWEHTGFETMFYYDATIRGIWPMLSMVACNISAILGFMVARRLVRSNKELSAYTLWLTAYTVTLAVVSCHYDRFLYPGGIREFYQGKTYQVDEFLQSELCIMLVLSLILVSAPVFYVQVFWPGAEGRMTRTRKAVIRWHCAIKQLQLGLVAIAIFVLLKLITLTPTAWGWDRMLAIAAGQLSGYILLLPVFLISTKYTVTRRLDIRRSKQQVAAMKRQGATQLAAESQLDEEEENDSYPVNESNGHVLNKDE